MNAKLLKRLFRAVASENPAGLRKIADAIVEGERRVGHTKLADELAGILKTELPKTAGPGELRRLRPLGAPTGLPFFSRTAPDELPHHMVLAPSVEARFEQIEREYAARSRLHSYGFKPRQRVLLYGPPGCGKTLGASRLAWSTGLPLLKVRFDALLSSMFGESASNLRQVFETSVEAPSLLLLDECDFIARSRLHGRDVGEAARIVNTLLQLLDDYDPPGLLVATTNIDKALDPAIFRRFDDVIEIPKPGPGEIVRLLETTLSAIETEPGIPWSSIAESLDNPSAADVVKLATDAAKAALICNRRVVTETDIRSRIGMLKTGTGTHGEA